ncbi:efflux RND transporter permease subunit [Pseudomonas aeruginosa]|nr:efflux RND transporter permease subunit [Pseudomonas aeruginosa]MCM8577122.1 efflux RND transporter permease subunit [Pseudomonas aeruginosa]
MARFFIDRPVFAWVISLLIVLAGVLAIRFLPVAQYPDIAPPVVNVSASRARPPSFRPTAPTFGASWTTGNSSSPTRCCDR